MRDAGALRLDASLGAVEFYRRLGYRALFEVEDFGPRGQVLRYAVMETLLRA